MREFTIHEAALKTNLSRSILQAAVISGIIPTKLKERDGRLLHYISEGDLTEFYKKAEQGPVFPDYQKPGKKVLQSPEEVASGIIKQRLYDIQEEARLRRELKEVYE